VSLLFKGRTKSATSIHIGWSQRLAQFWISHIRQALSSLGEIWRVPLASLMTIGVLGLSITLPSTLYILVKNTEKVSAGWEQAAEVSLFLQKGISDNEVQALVTRLELWPEIAEIEYTPADEALDEFKQISGFGDALAYLDENPLPDVLLITPTSKHAGPTAAQALLNKLRKQREVDVGKLDVEWLERLHAFLSIARDIVNMIGLLLFLAVILIVGNTIRLNILNKRDEILVMKLVGATDAFIQRPFLYTGFWYGLLGGLFALFAVSILLWWMSFSISETMALYQKSFNLTGMSLNASITMLTVSIALGLTGSFISVKQHVKAIEPQ
jgi:cell division transport system permease protein